MNRDLRSPLSGQPSRRWRRPCQLGLTMIEILIGLAVMVILAALAVPAMGQRLAHQRLVMAAETLAADLNEARFEAARSGLSQRVTALADPDGRTWCWAIQPAHEAPTIDCACTAQRQCGHRTVAAADHVGVRMPQARQVTLSPGTQGQTATVAVLASPEGERLRVDLMALGRPRICSLSAPPTRYAPCP